MGQEATCFVRFGGQRSEGRARLESDDLQFRGEFRLKIPLTSIRQAVARDGDLIVDTPDGQATFELGATAAKWAKRITRPPTLMDKLGLKPGQRVLLAGRFDNDFTAALQDAGLDTTGEARPENDVVFLDARRREDLAHLAVLQQHLKRNGAIWVVRPRGVPEISERDVMAAGKEAGLVDVKVARFSETHTAEKLVIPLSRR